MLLLTYLDFLWSLCGLLSSRGLFLSPELELLFLSLELECLLGDLWELELELLCLSCELELLCLLGELCFDEEDEDLCLSLLDELKQILFSKNSP